MLDFESTQVHIATPWENCRFSLLRNEKRITSKGLIQPIILCELVWVLESAYGYEKGEIIAVIEQVMRTAQFEISEKDQIWRALEDFSEGPADFSDYVIGCANARAGAPTTLTFDRSLRGCPLFRMR